METSKFMGSIERYVNFIINDARTSGRKVVFSPEDDKRSKKYKGRKAPEVLGKCPLCEGDVLENSKGYYCTNWRQGCKFTIWKNDLQVYGTTVTPDMIKTLLANGKIENFHICKPDTNEEFYCTVTMTPVNGGRLILSNMRKEEK